MNTRTTYIKILFILKEYKPGIVRKPYQGLNNKDSSYGYLKLAKS